jgi:archaellum component FlaC
MPADEATEAQRHEDTQRRLTEVEANVARISERLDKVASDVHTMKGNMAGNTALTQETLAGVDSIKTLIGQLDIPSLRDIAEAMNSMKGGVKVLGWLERPAKWIAAMAGAAAALYALWKLK